MSPIFTIHFPNGDHDIDLRTIRDVWAYHDPKVRWRIERDAPHECIEADATLCAPIRTAWRAYHATPKHPAEVPDGRPSEFEPAKLPEGWRWEGDDAAGPDGERVIARRGWVRMSGLETMGHEAPIAVIEAVIAAHRARLGGAS